MTDEEREAMKQCKHLFGTLVDFENMSVACIKDLFTLADLAVRLHDEGEISDEWLMSFPGAHLDRDTILIPFGDQDSDKYIAVESDRICAIQEGQYSDSDCNYIAITKMGSTRGQLAMLLALLKGGGT